MSFNLAPEDCSKSKRHKSEEGRKHVSCHKFQVS